ncbi:substrate-binding domain-containing protein [Nocardiopsis suaedae]|uniref:Substrate-binding domain-containing protein n=1 Tax=Nocardiopsis suaedae TaxID=3018444 RepID=A0ABT4THN1_9ACTN|nr:substrate-binding domain-containing protein [Nocardiopsis suaedae]MDA2804165.1 substrate-binding domain-containing protein [Nocardiopsis suaedae]
MREPVGERRRRILAAVRARGEVRVADLASELEVSVVTVRRDVEVLAQEGRLRRGHGSARSLVPAERPSAPPPGGPGAVALVVPERHAYLNEVMYGARTALEAAGMRVVLHIAPQVEGAERPIVERIPHEGVRGLLIAPRWRSAAEEEADQEWLARLDRPTVLMERRPRPGGPLHTMDAVCSDHGYGVRLAVDHLVGLGHRRIVLAARADSPTARAVRAAFTEVTEADPRVEDWAAVLSAEGADADGGAGPEPDFDDPGWLAALLRRRGATAALLHGDVDALMLVQRLAEAGVRVPEDCSVVAYDDVVAALGAIPLTAVAPPKAEVGRVAAELMRDRLAAEAAGTPWSPRRVEVLPRLEVRASTRAAAPD